MITLDPVNLAVQLGSPDLCPRVASGSGIWSWVVSEPHVAIPLKAGIPTLHHLSQNSFGNNNSILPLSSKNLYLFLTSGVVIVVANHCFRTPYFDYDLTTNSRGWGRLSNNISTTPRISWTMKQAHDAPAAFTGCFLRSVDYRSSITCKFLAIPANGAAFFTSSLFDIQNLWLNQVAMSRSYILHNVCDPRFIYR